MAESLQIVPESKLFGIRKREEKIYQEEIRKYDDESTQGKEKKNEMNVYRQHIEDKTGRS